MGVQARLVLYAPEEALARASASAAFARLAEVDTALSDWRIDGELARVEAAADGTPQPVGPELGACLARALELARASGGAFDPTLGPLTRLWRAARSSGRAPDSAALAAASELCGWQRLRLDLAAGTLSMPAGTQLDLGGIGKGYGADRALAVLRAHGIERALVGLAGDHAAGEPPPGSQGWRLRAEAHPGGELVLRGSGVATSGDSEQFFVLDGVRHSHVLDPRTGLGVVARPWVTVVAPDATTADALASALSVLGPQEAEKLRAAFPQARITFAGESTP